MGSSGRHSRRRQQILRAAERLLQHYGFAKTTVADIASEAGVGVGTVYLDFKSKNEIVGALAEERHERLLSTIRWALDSDGPFPDRLRGLLQARIEALFAFAAEGQHGADLVSCACPSVDRVKATFRSEEESLLARFLAAAHASGELHVPDPAGAARVILRIYDSFSPLSGTARSVSDVADDLRTTHELLIDGLRARRS